MAKFRKKPIVIEAFRWTGGPDQEEDPSWIVAAILTHNVWFAKVGTPAGRWTRESVMHIKTFEGVMTAEPGDWIIRGVKGELYPCKPDIFEATYEPVD